MLKKKWLYARRLNKKTSASRDALECFIQTKGEVLSSVATGKLMVGFSFQKFLSLVSADDEFHLAESSS